MITYLVYTEEKTPDDMPHVQWNWIPVKHRQTATNIMNEICRLVRIRTIGFKDLVYILTLFVCSQQAANQRKMSTQDGCTPRKWQNFL